MENHVLEHVIAKLGDSQRLHVSRAGRISIAAADSVRVISDLQIDAKESRGTVTLHVVMKPFSMLDDVTREEIDDDGGSTLVLFGNFRFVRSHWQLTSGGYELELTFGDNVRCARRVVMRILRHILDKT